MSERSGRLRRRAAWPAVLVAAVLAVSACSGTQASATAPASSTAPVASTASISPSTSAPNSSAPAGSGGTAVTLPKPELTNLKFGYIVVAADPANEIAVEDGLFTKYGLTVTPQLFTTEPSQDQALLAGQVDVLGNAGVAGAIGSLLTTSPLVIPFMNHDSIGDDLYTSASVKTAQDLKGKAIAISTFGSATYGEALIFLQSLGLSPSDVTITQVGNDAARRAALAAGSVQASIDDQGLAAQMGAAGFNVLVQGSKMTVGLAQSAMATTLAFAQKNPNTMLAIVAALTEGMHIFLTNPTEAEQAAAKFENISIADATTNYNGNIVGWSPVNGRTTLAEMQAAQQLYVKTDPTLASVDVSKAFTNQFFDQLQSLGWYQAMGIQP